MVHGFEIRDGHIYVGRGMRSSSGAPEPALIDPTLPIDNRISADQDDDLGYWPSYRDLTPGNRAVYLAWLTGGRRNPATPVGFVFPFIYGLERRVLVDIVAEERLESELPGIRETVVDLVDRYGPASDSFHRYATGLIGLIDALVARRSTHPLPIPELRADRYAIPETLRIELGRRAAQGDPIPADLALAWAWYLPEVSPRTPATRCREEFARLFGLRFQRKYPNGMTLRPGAARLELPYSSASAGFQSVAVRLPEIPDVFAQKGPGRALAALFDGVTNELDPYSRWLGRNPDGAGSLASFALLPADLATAPSPAVDRLNTWATDRLGSRFAAKVPGAEILKLWRSGPNVVLSKAESVSLAQLLGNLNIGIEPDVRFGGVPIADGGEWVLFRAEPNAPHAPTTAYSAASTLVHLAAAVGIADGGVSSPEVNQLGEHMRSSLGLTTAEMGRLYAHFLWLTTNEVKLSGLQKRLGVMTAEQRRRIGEVMIAVASADGVVSPSEVTMLTKIYRLLGLDPAGVTSQLHASLASGPAGAAVNPVTVQGPGQPEPGYRIPPRPQPAPGQSQGHPAPRPLALDTAAIERKLAETAEVGALLANLFVEADDPGPAKQPAAVPVTPSETAPPAIGALDGTHSLFLRAVAKRPSWTRQDFDALAAEYRIMPDGAIDVLNEAAYEACGEPIIEGDDDLSINPYATEAMLA